MNDIRRFDRSSYGPKLETRLGAVGQENLKELVVKIDHIEGDQVDISSLAQAVLRLLDEMEADLREGLLNIISIEKKMEVNSKSLEGLKDLLDWTGDLEGERSEELGRGLDELNQEVKDILQLKERESKRILEGLRGTTQNHDPSRNDSGGDGLEKTRPQMRREEFIQALESDLEDWLDLLGDLDFPKSTEGKKAGDLDQPSFLDLDGLEREEEGLLAREARSGPFKGPDQARQKLEGLVRLLAKDDRELGLLLDRSLDDEAIEKDRIFKKFKLDLDPDYRDKLYLEVAREREKRLLEFEEDYLVRKSYREGRRDINLALNIVDILKNKGISLEDFLKFMSLILLLVFLLKIAF